MAHHKPRAPLLLRQVILHPAQRLVQPFHGLERLCRPALVLRRIEDHDKG